MKEIEDAKTLVNKLISDYEAKLKAMAASDDEQEPVLIDGETETGYICQIMVDPKKVIPILLKYDYPTYKTLGGDFPDAMWRELGRHLGIANALSVDL